MNTKQLSAAAVAMLLIGGGIGAAHAAGMQPGESIGQGYGTPLPQGVYVWNTLSYGQRANQGGPGVDGDVFVDVPVVAWSTPLVLLGGRVELALATPWIYEGFNRSDGAGPVPSSDRGIYNPFLAGLWAFDLGGGLGLSLLSGAYIPWDSGSTGVAADFWTFREAINVAYSGVDGLHAAANLNFQFFDSKHDNTVTFSQNNNFVADLTLGKTFGKWDVAAVGFASTNIDNNFSPVDTSQVALGGLVGYNFGPVTIQFFLTRDVTEHNLGGSETRIWNRIVVPIP